MKTLMIAAADFATLMVTSVVLRRLRALCLLRLILRRLSLLLTGNTSIDERRFEAITSPAGVLGG